MYIYIYTSLYIFSFVCTVYYFCGIITRFPYTEKPHLSAVSLVFWSILINYTKNSDGSKSCYIFYIKKISKKIHTGTSNSTRYSNHLPTADVTVSH